MSEYEEKLSENRRTETSVLRLGSGLVAVAVLATVVVAGGSREKDEPRPQEQRPTRTKIEVSTINPRRAAIKHIIEHSGRIEGFEETALYAKVNGFVRAYHATTADTKNAPPLFNIVRIDKMRIFIDVPEADAASVRNGGPAVVIIHALGEQVFDGHVVRLGWMLNDQTRTLRTEIDLPNPEGRLRPGMRATALLPVECPAALTVPSSAVFQQDDQWWVVCVEDSKAIRKPVRPGVRQGGLVEILPPQAAPETRGETATWKDFTGAELVVRDNPRSLTDGQEVQSKFDEAEFARTTRKQSSTRS